ncbi:MAG: DUF885 domain-containing protein [Terracidiphilus sp.]
MNRVVLSTLLAFTFASSAPALLAQAPPLAPLADRQAALHSFFKDYWDAYLQHSPEFASTIGDTRFNDQITDYSVQAVNDWLAVEQNDLIRLAAIDPTGFTEQEKTSRELLLRDFLNDEEAAEFKEWEMPINQMGGIYSAYPDLVAQLNFTTVKDYDDWVARLHKVPKAFDQVMTNMSIGMDDQRVPPRYILEKALAEVRQLATQKPEDSPLALPLKKFPSTIPATEQTRIREEMLRVIQRQVLPAYQRLAQFLQASYIPAGREQPGIWALPDGTKYYQFLIRRNTSTNLTAEEIHQIGLAEVKKDEAAMLAIAQKLGFKDLKSFEASLKTNPKLHPASAEALLNTYRGYLDPMKAKLPQFFGHLPKAPFEVLPVPDYLAKDSAPAYYEAGTADGTRPGRLYIDTYDAPQRNLYDAEAIAYHEGIPGHHLQISIAHEIEGIPEFRKYEAYTAYTEGWGLYSEQLGKDVGFFQDPYSDYGRLESDMWRAIRLVVDTGVHSKHWTRQQMVDYFHEHSAIDDASVQPEVDRYIAWPGQALAYKIGQLKILELRDKAKAELGPKFDIRAFHDHVLDSGALPLDLLSDEIDAWIAASR